MAIIRSCAICVCVCILCVCLCVCPLDAGASSCYGSDGQVLVAQAPLAFNMYYSDFVDVEQEPVMIPTTYR